MARIGCCFAGGKTEPILVIPAILYPPNPPIAEKEGIPVQTKNEQKTPINSTIKKYFL
jgi:hypothetical protein